MESWWYFNKAVIEFNSFLTVGNGDGDVCPDAAVASWRLWFR